jgi:hypothetical protein
LNPRLPLCESGDHTGLIYRPPCVFTEENLRMRFRGFGSKNCQAGEMKEREEEEEMQPPPFTALPFRVAEKEWVLFCLKEIFHCRNIAETLMKQP